MFCEGPYEMAVQSSVCEPALASIFAFVCFGGFVSVASRGAFAFLHYSATSGVLSLHSLLHLDPHFQTEGALWTRKGTA